MQTFSILFKCLPCFGFMGLYFLLTGLVPSWRDKGWNHWKVYGIRRPRNSNSWSVQLGFAKPTKPLAEGDFDEKSGVSFYSVVGTLFLIIGLGGLVLIVYLSTT